MGASISLLRAFTSLYLVSLYTHIQTPFVSSTRLSRSERNNPIVPCLCLLFKRLPQKVPSLPFPYLKIRLELALDFAPVPVQLRMLTAGPFNTH